MEVEEIIILLVIAAVIGNSFLHEIQPEMQKDIQGGKSLFISILNYHPTWHFYLVLSIIFLPSLFYLNYRFNLSIAQKLREYKEAKARKKAEHNKIKQLIEKSIASISHEEIGSYLHGLREGIHKSETEREFTGYKESLLKKIKKAEHVAEELRHKEKIRELHGQQSELKQGIASLQEQYEAELRKQEREKETLLKDLNTPNHSVFKKSQISKEEIEVLKEDGYQQVNEYCPHEQKLLTVLVKQILNHSSTHTFLVWSLVRMLGKVSGVYHIEESDTKEADIIFKYRRIEFALEVETGTLLGKSQQTQKKIEHLDERFGNRWMFVVSNEKLAPKYRKLGFVTTRKRVLEDLQNMLKTRTHQQGVRGGSYRCWNGAERQF